MLARFIQRMLTLVSHCAPDMLIKQAMNVLSEPDQAILEQTSTELSGNSTHYSYKLFVDLH